LTSDLGWDYIYRFAFAAVFHFPAVKRAGIPRLQRKMGNGPSSTNLPEAGTNARRDFILSDGD